MTREDIVQMARKARLDIYGLGKNHDTFMLIVENFVNQVASAEREACAKVCDEFPDVGYIDKKLTVDYHSYLIRQRGQA